MAGQTTQTKNRFAILNAINVGDHIEKKNGLSYLSWAWAWTEFKKVFPDSYYTVYETPEGLNYFTDGRTCWVKTGVTLVDGDFKLEHIEYLPVMNMRNASIEQKAVTSTEVNKTIQRSLTKAIARHGLGCYIYAGEDLPEETEEEKQAKERAVMMIGSIDAEIRRITKDMSRDQKIAFANDVVVPAVGQTNYKNCTDPAKLESLYSNLKKIA